MGGRTTGISVTAGPHLFIYKHIGMQKTDKLSEIKLYYKPLSRTMPQIRSSHEAYSHLLKFFNQDTLAIQEQFVAIYLNRSNCLLGGYLCSVGGITGTVADIRLILAVALKSGASGMIVSHNHPSGNLKPSNVDQDLTNKLKEAAAIMDIQLLDHLIISSVEGEFFSFAENGLL